MSSDSLVLTGVKKAQMDNIASRIVPVPKTLPKAQRTQGLSSAYQSDFFLKVISQAQTPILIKFHLQNLDQASQPNISNSSKLRIKNIDQA